MRRGDTFYRYGSHWMALEVTHEHNERFEWDTVVAVWSCFGPPPFWPDKSRKFHMNRRRRVLAESL